ncbi:unnamed protein product [Meloidogyne enterolobii]|uniref:Uncharacterized protein n=1 Tax=Meloidogyne enterolobii TaxID=390850 RepID=A0ACB0XKN9_MELEN
MYVCLFTKNEQKKVAYFSLRSYDAWHQNIFCSMFYFLLIFTPTGSLLFLKFAFPLIFL